MREYIIFPVIIDIIIRCCDPALTWRIAYFAQALLYTAFEFQFIKNLSSCCAQHWHAQFKWSFQHYRYCENKSYNWKRCEFQNEKFKAYKQNVLELRLDVTLQSISNQRAKVCKPHKLWVLSCKSSIKYCRYSHDRFKVFATYYWFS